MPLYFIRHGEAHANEQNRFAGRLDTPLTDLGLRQARQAARRVVALGVRIDEVHVSPLSRARMTAEIITAALPEPPAQVITDTALVERDFGVYSGRNKSLVKKSIGFAGYTEAFHSHTGCPPGGEKWSEMYERTAAYYREVLLPAARSGRTVLVVAHKYIVEMFALLAAEMPAEACRDLKIPNARPLTEDDLRRAALAPAAAGLLNDLGELVEIRLPFLVVTAALLGVIAQEATGVEVPARVFSTLMTAFLGVGAFFAMLRVDPSALRGLRDTFRPTAGPLLLRLTVGLALLGMSHTLALQLAGLFFLMPPALIAPTLSLLWGGDYVFAVRHTIAASVALPAVLFVGAFLVTGPQHLAPALVTYAAVLLAALLLPGVAAQSLRRRDPIRAGALSTNWNWCGSLALVPLAGLATFGLTPTTGLTARGVPATLMLTILVTGALLAALRLGTVVFVRLCRTPSALGRDVFITQNTPNVFLWLAMTAVLAPPSGHNPSVLGLGVALVFFAAVYVDEYVFLRGHTRDLRARQRAVGAGAAAPDYSRL